MPTTSTSNSDTQIILQLGRDSYPATYLKGEEFISAPFNFKVEFLAPESFNVRDFLV